jgi:hypothetical protein
VLPNFLIIGAARCGTTTLYSHLQTHPDVYLPLTKRPEPHFFLKEAEYSQGLPYYEQRFFAAWHGQRAVGEASTSYVYGEQVPGRVAGALPGVRLICMLRNPVERAFSGYWHSVVSGLETLSFEDALAQEQTRKIEFAGTPLGEIAPFAYVERGLYHQQLTRWLTMFDRSRLQIILLEDLLARPQQTCSDVASFLGIDPEVFPTRQLGKENTSVPAGATMPPDLYRSLAAQFRDDVSALARMIDRDLNHWLDVPS